MNTIKKTLVAAGVTLSTLVGAQASALAAPCGSATTVGRDIWAQWGDTIKQKGCKNDEECLDNASKYEEIIKALVTFWNKEAGSTWATIGPRALDFGVDLDGTLVSTGGRVFVARGPSDKDTVEVKVTKKDGAAKTSLTICRIDKAGNSVKIADGEFDKGDKDGTTITKKVSGVKGYVIAVELDSKAMTKKLVYTLQAKK